MRPVTTAVVLLAAASVTTCTPLSSSGASVSNHDRMRLWMARRSEVASRIIAAWVANEHDPGAAAVVPVLEDDKRRRGRRREPLMVSEAAGGAVEYADGGNRARDVSPSAEAASGQIIHVPLHNWLTSTDLQWYCNITVGTPPQLLYVSRRISSPPFCAPFESGRAPEGGGSRPLALACLVNRSTCVEAMN